jgi:hypothetical protein
MIILLLIFTITLYSINDLKSREIKIVSKKYEKKSKRLLTMILNHDILNS